MEHIERIHRELKYTGSMLEFYTDTIKVPNGNTAKWDFINHHGAAAVLPVTDEGKIVLVRQYRNALDRETLEIPAGGLNGADEPTRTAAIRELEEETGFRADSIEPLISVVTAVAFCNEVIDVYLATGLHQFAQKLDEEEFIEVEAYTVEELTDMIFAGTIQDSKTVAAVMAYAYQQKK